jgi:hypothetical protein
MRILSFGREGVMRGVPSELGVGVDSFERAEGDGVCSVIGDG